MNCPQCGASNEARDSFCNECGYNFSSKMKIVPLDQPRPPKRRNRQGPSNQFISFWFVSTVIIFLIIVFLFKA